MRPMGQKQMDPKTAAAIAALLGQQGGMAGPSMAMGIGQGPMGAGATPGIPSMGPPPMAGPPAGGGGMGPGALAGGGMVGTFGMLGAASDQANAPVTSLINSLRGTPNFSPHRNYGNDIGALIDGLMGRGMHGPGEGAQGVMGGQQQNPIGADASEPPPAPSMSGPASGEFSMAPQMQGPMPGMETDFTNDPEALAISGKPARPPMSPQSAVAGMMGAMPKGPGPDGDLAAGLAGAGRPPMPGGGGPGELRRSGVEQLDPTFGPTFGPTTMNDRMNGRDTAGVGAPPPNMGGFTTDRSVPGGPTLPMPGMHMGSLARGAPPPIDQSLVGGDSAYDASKKKRQGYYGGTGRL